MKNFSFYNNKKRIEKQQKSQKMGIVLPIMNYYL